MSGVSETLIYEIYVVPTSNTVDVSDSKITLDTSFVVTSTVPFSDASHNISVVLLSDHEERDLSVNETVSSATDNNGTNQWTVTYNLSSTNGLANENNNPISLLVQLKDADNEVINTATHSVTISSNSLNPPTTPTAIDLSFNADPNESGSELTQILSSWTPSENIDMTTTDIYVDISGVYYNEFSTKVFSEPVNVNGVDILSSAFTSNIYNYVQFAYPGYYEITMKATDIYGNSDSQKYNLYIKVSGTNSISLLKSDTEQNVVGRTYTNIFTGKITGVLPSVFSIWITTNEVYLFDVVRTPIEGNFVNEYEYEYENASNYDSSENLTLSQVVELVNSTDVGVEITITSKQGEGYESFDDFNISDNIPSSFVINKNDVRGKFRLNGVAVTSDTTLTVDASLNTTETFVFDISRNTTSQKDYTIDTIDTTVVVNAYDLGYQTTNNVAPHPNVEPSFNIIITSDNVQVTLFKNGQADYDVVLKIVDQYDYEYRTTLTYHVVNNTPVVFDIPSQPSALTITGSGGSFDISTNFLEEITELNNVSAEDVQEDLSFSNTSDYFTKNTLVTMVWSSVDASYTLVNDVIYEDASTNKPTELSDTSWNNFITEMNNVTITYTLPNSSGLRNTQQSATLSVPYTGADKDTGTFDISLNANVLDISYNRAYDGSSNDILYPLPSDWYNILLEGSTYTSRAGVTFNIVDASFDEYNSSNVNIFKSNNVQFNFEFKINNSNKRYDVSNIEMEDISSITLNYEITDNDNEVITDASLTYNVTFESIPEPTIEITSLPSYDTLDYYEEPSGNVVLQDELTDISYTLTHAFTDATEPTPSLSVTRLPELWNADNDNADAFKIVYDISFSDYLDISASDSSNVILGQTQAITPNFNLSTLSNKQLDYDDTSANAYEWTNWVIESFGSTTVTSWSGTYTDASNTEDISYTELSKITFDISDQENVVLNEENIVFGEEEGTFIQIDSKNAELYFTNNGERGSGAVSQTSGNIYKLTEDLTFSSDVYMALGAGETFDGNNHTIDMSYDVYFGGLFTTSGTSIETGSVVKNLGVLGGTITGGAVIKNNQGFFTVEYCYSTGDIDDRVGGICGRQCNSALITNCYSTGLIGTYAGGITGVECGSYSNSIEITNCYSTGAIGLFAGGITGYLSGRSSGSCIVSNCYSTGPIGTLAGGIAGYGSGIATGFFIVTNCYSTGDIGDDAAGIVGTGGGNFNTTIPGVCKVENCYSQQKSGNINTGFSNEKEKMDGNFDISLLFGISDASLNGTDVPFNSLNASVTVDSFTSEGNQWVADTFGTEQEYPLLKSFREAPWDADVYVNYNISSIHLEPIFTENVTQPLSSILTLQQRESLNSINFELSKTNEFNTITADGNLEPDAPLTSSDQFTVPIDQIDPPVPQLALTQDESSFELDFLTNSTGPDVYDWSNFLDDIISGTGNYWPGSGNMTSEDISSITQNNLTINAVFDISGEAEVTTTILFGKSLSYYISDVQQREALQKITITFTLTNSQGGLLQTPKSVTSQEYDVTITQKEIPVPVLTITDNHSVANPYELPEDDGPWEWQDTTPLRGAYDGSATFWDGGDSIVTIDIDNITTENLTGTVVFKFEADSNLEDVSAEVIFANKLSDYIPDSDHRAVLTSMQITNLRLVNSLGGLSQQQGFVEFNRDEGEDSNDTSGDLFISIDPLPVNDTEVSGTENDETVTSEIIP